MTISGHAIEARIYAEDPANNFLPSIGTLVHLRTPLASKHVRVDGGVEQGDQISPFYDPMIAKLIVWDETREQALETISRALADFQVAGVRTNIEFLKRLVATRSFAEADLDTGLIEHEAEVLFAKPAEAPAKLPALAALALLETERATTKPDRSPWSVGDGWRVNSVLRRTLTFLDDGQSREVQVEYAGKQCLATIGGETFDMIGDLDAEG